MKKFLFTFLVLCIMLPFTAEAKPEGGKPAGKERRMASGPAVAKKSLTRSENPIITEQPEGEVRWVNRQGGSFNRGFWDVDGEYAIIFGEIGSYSCPDGTAAKMVFGTDGFVYLKSPISQSYLCRDSYIKGEIKDSQLVFKLPQTVAILEDEEEEGEFYNYDVNRLMFTQTDEGMEIGIVPPEENQIVFEKTEEGWKMKDSSADGSDYIIGLTCYDIWQEQGDCGVELLNMNMNPTVAPEGLKLEEWNMVYDNFGKQLLGGTLDNKLWLKGVDAAYPDSYIVGEIKDNSVIFENGQFLGFNEEEEKATYFCVSDLELSDSGMPLDEDVILTPTFTFAWDAELQKASTEEYMGLYSSGYRINPWDNSYRLFGPGYFVKAPAEMSYKPAKPILSGESEYEDISEEWTYTIAVVVPTVNSDGYLLDMKNMSLRIFFDGEPKVWDDTLFPGLSSPLEWIKWGSIYYDEETVNAISYTNSLLLMRLQGRVPAKEIGVQSYYDDNGTMVASDMLTFIPAASAPEFGAADQEVMETEYFSLQGVRVMHPDNGIYIVKETLADGSLRTRKCVLR